MYVSIWRPLFFVPNRVWHIAHCSGDQPHRIHCRETRRHSYIPSRCPRNSAMHGCRAKCLGWYTNRHPAPSRESVKWRATSRFRENIEVEDHRCNQCRGGDSSLYKSYLKNLTSLSIDIHHYRRRDLRRGCGESQRDSVWSRNQYVAIGRDMGHSCRCSTKERKSRTDTTRHLLQDLY